MTRPHRKQGISMKQLVVSIALLFALFPLSSYADDPGTLDDFVNQVKALKAQGASNKEVADYVSRVVDRRIDNANTAEGAWRKGAFLGEAIKYWTGKEVGEGIKTDARYAKERENIPGARHGRDYEDRAKWAWDLRYGACNETSAISYHVLKEAGYDPKILESPGHNYAVIGLDPKANVGDPKTWGTNAAGVDGWQGKAFTPEEAYNNRWIGNGGKSTPVNQTGSFDDPKLYGKYQAAQERKQKEEESRKKAEADARRKAEEDANRKAEEEAKRKAEEEAKRKAALQAALKQAEALIAAARAAAGRAQSAIGAAKGAAAAGNAATSLASAAQGAVQQAKGAADAARSACARIVSEGIIDAARARAEASASEVGAIYQEAVNLAAEACKIAALKASQTWAQENNRKLSQGLAAQAKTKVGSAQAAVARARAEVAQAAQHNANRQAAQQASAAAKAALAGAQGQVSAANGAINAHETTVSKAQAQLEAARSAAGEVESNKKAAIGVLSPFMSESEVQYMLPVINGIVAPSSEGVDQQLQAALTAIQQARATVASLPDLLATWGGSFATCDALAPTDGLVQAATAAASAAELFLPKIGAAAGRAAECAGAGALGTDPVVAGGKSDVQGATQAGTEFQGQTPGGKPPGETSGVTGGGKEPIPIPGQQTGQAGAGEPGASGQTPLQQGIWCISEKTKEWYMIPYGPCPPPGMKPSGESVRVPWQGLVPGEKPPMGEKSPMGGGGACPPGCHIKPATGKCHCGGM